MAEITWGGQTAEGNKQANTPYTPPTPSASDNRQSTSGAPLSSVAPPPSVQELPPVGAIDGATSDTGAQDLSNVKFDPKTGNMYRVNTDGSVETRKDGKVISTIPKAEMDKGVDGAAKALLAPGTGAAVLSGVASAVPLIGSILSKVVDKTVGGEPTQQQIDEVKAAALEAAGGDTYLAYRILSGDASKDDVDKYKLENQGKATPAVQAPSIPTPPVQGGRDQPGSTHAATPVVQAAPVPVAPVAPVKTPEQIATEQAQATNAAEKARFEALVKSYNPMANMEQFSAVNVGTAKNPTIAEAEKKMNDLIALGARSDAVGQQARTDLSQLTQMTPENRDAWLQYYRPQDYVATAAQGVAGQAATPNVAQAQQMQGTYQGDLSALRNYDSQIARSSERENAVQLGDLLMRRAQGLEPSVAELSYKQNLDALSAAQGAAAGSMRGQDRALGLRSLAGNVSQQGQKAVGDTAILRLQEQQAAEQAAAAQYNAIMIEDQKVSSQEKINELSRSINLVQGELANAQNTLEKDKFNADAINTSNRLEAQLRSQVDMLNAQQRTQASLENASMQTNVSLQNAMKALEANKWAGTAAQSSLENQLALERGDWTRGYTTQRDSLADIYGSTQGVAKDLATIGAAQEGWQISSDRLSAEKSWEDAKNQRLDNAATAAEEQAFYQSLFNVGTAAGIKVADIMDTIEKKKAEAAKQKQWWE
jgi:hypothetical protein